MLYEALQLLTALEPQHDTSKLSTLNKWSCYNSTLTKGHNCYLAAMLHMHTPQDHSRSLQV